MDYKGFHLNEFDLKGLYNNFISLVSSLSLQNYLLNKLVLFLIYFFLFYVFTFW